MDMRMSAGRYISTVDIPITHMVNQQDFFLYAV